MRIAIAALLGAITMFFWQFIAHMVLPIGTMGFRLPQQEDAVLRAVGEHLPQPGIYLLPSIDPAKMGDEVVAAAWIEKAKVNPFVFLVAADPAPMNLGPMLGKQFTTTLFGALLAAWVLSATTWGFRKRVLGGLGIGLCGWLSNAVPQSTWYHFPADFVLGSVLEQGIGWLLGGVAIAWWLGRR